jgi:soluble lytic murein transglycosylase-like protein
MKFARQLALLFFLGSTLAQATDLAILRNGFSIQHGRREQHGNVTRLYLTASADSGFIEIPTEQITCFQRDDYPVAVAKATVSATEKASAPARQYDIEKIVAAASDRHLVDADLIASLIRAESSFNARAVSPKGAQGLMQLMPGTATKLGVSDSFDPDANVDAGTRYLRDLLVQYNGDIVKALAAYNAGPHRVAKYKGVPPYKETHAYVARIVREFNRKKLAQQKATTKAGVGRKIRLADSRSRHDPAPVPVSR